MHQGGRLQGLPGPFTGHLGGCQPPQLLVDQWQQLLRSLRFASLHRIQESCHLAHVIASMSLSNWVGQVRATGECAVAVENADRATLERI